MQFRQTQVILSGLDIRDSLPNEPHPTIVKERGKERKREAERMTTYIASHNQTALRRLNCPHLGETKIWDDGSIECVDCGGMVKDGQK